MAEKGRKSEDSESKVDFPNRDKTSTVPDDISLQKIALTVPSGPLLRDVHDRVVPGSLKDAKIEKNFRYLIQDRSNAKGTYVSGMQVTPDGNIVFCDWNNNKVKLLDCGANKIKHTLVMQNSPWDILLVNEREALVTLTGNRTIEVVSIENGELKHLKDRSIKTTLSCFGMAYLKPNLYVTCTEDDHAEVLIIDKNGDKIDKVPIPDKIKWPFHIAADYFDRLYITDYHAHSVTCVTTSGKIVYTKESKKTKLFYPSGALVDSEQNLYAVCSHRLVQVFGKDGQLDKRLIVLDCNQDYHPLSIAYRASDGILLLGMHGDHILRFKCIWK